MVFDVKGMKPSSFQEGFQQFISNRLDWNGPDPVNLLV